MGAFSAERRLRLESRLTSSLAEMVRGTRDSGRGVCQVVRGADNVVATSRWNLITPKGKVRGWVEVRLATVYDS